MFFQINLFLQSLAHTPVGFTMGGLFMITKESAVTVSIAQRKQLLVYYSRGVTGENHLWRITLIWRRIGCSGIINYN